MPVFLTKLPWKWLGPALAAIALAGLLYLGINAGKAWYKDVRDSAFQAGVDQATAAFNATRAEEARQSLDRFARQVEQSNAAVQVYLQDIAAREPLVVTATREIERYAATADGGTVCLDAGGVRLLQQARTAAASGPATDPGSGPPAR